MSKARSDRRRKEKSSESEGHNWKRIGLGLFVIGIIVLSFRLATLPNSPLRSGWEPDAGTNRISIGGQSFSLGETEGLLPGSEISYGTSEFKVDDGDLLPQFDEGPEYYGTPKLGITVGYPVHVRKVGDVWVQTPDDSSPYRKVSKNVGETTHWFDHHVYWVSVSMRTYATTTGAFATETYWWYDDQFIGTCERLPSLQQEDHTASIRVYFEFSLDPWNIEDGQIVKYEGSDYEISDAFYGIMSASIYDITALGPIETVPEADSTHSVFPGHSSTMGKNARVNMFTTSDAYVTNYQSISEADTLDPDSVVVADIQQKVILEVTGEMEPGMIVTQTDPWTWQEVTPINHNIVLLVRVDTMYTAGYTLVSGDQDFQTDNTEWQPPPDIEQWSLLDLFSGPGVGIFLAVIVAVVGLGCCCMVRRE